MMNEVEPMHDGDLANLRDDVFKRECRISNEEAKQLFARLDAVQEDRNSWERVATRIEGEKQALQAVVDKQSSRLAEAVELFEYAAPTLRCECMDEQTGKPFPATAMCISCMMKDLSDVIQREAAACHPRR